MEVIKRKCRYIIYELWMCLLMLLLETEHFTNDLEMKSHIKFTLS